MARYECTDCEEKTDDECVLVIEDEKNEKKYPDTCPFGGCSCNWVCCGDS